MSLPAVKLVLEDGTDITGRLLLSRGITITRGRTNERAAVEPGAMTLTLDNSDGGLTLGRTSSVSPAWKRGCRIRLSVGRWFGQVRFTGYVQSAPVRMVGGRVLSEVTVTCVDRLGIMAQAPLIRPWSDELIDEMLGTRWPELRYWWALDEPSIATTAAEETRTLPLYSSLVGNPGGGYTLADCLQFGQSASAGVEMGSQVTLRRQSDGTGAILSRSNGFSWNGFADSGGDSNAGMVYGVIFTPLATGDSSAQAILTLSGSDAGGTYTVTAARKGWALVLTETDTYGSGMTVTQTYPKFFAADAAAWVMICQYAGESTLWLVTATGATGFSSYRREVGGIPSFTSVQLGPAEGSYSNLTVRAGTNKYLGVRPDFDRLADTISAMIGEGSGLVVRWLERALSAASLDVGVDTFHHGGDTRRMQRPALKGSSPAAVGEALSQACGGMFVVDTSGDASWIDPSWSESLATLTSTDWGGDVTSDVDLSLAYTRVDVDGSPRRSTDGFPPSSISIPGLLPDPELEAYLNWLSNAADVLTGPRTNGITVELLHQDEATRIKYTYLDLKSRIFCEDLPAPFPAQWVQTVEGYTETISHQAWTITYNTAPDPSFVIERDPTGIVGGPYRVAYP